MRVVHPALTGPEAASWPQWPLLAFCGALYLAFLSYLWWGLGLELLQSDARGYWIESLKWRRPFSPWWVPGYPLTLALVSGLTGHQLAPVMVMLVTSAAFYLAGIAAARALGRSLGLGERSANLAALLVAVWPFVGLAYAVYPIADSMATALVLSMLLALVRRRWVLFAAAAAACLLTHKATWYFVIGAMAMAWRSRDARPWCVAAFAPLALLALAGGVYHGDPLWMVRWSVEHLFEPQAGLPILDGALGVFVTGQPAKLAKGVVVLAVMSLAVWTCVQSWRHRFWLGLAVALPVVAMGVTLNQYEIWAVVRFSKPLVVPAVVCARPLFDRLPLPARLAIVTGSIAAGLAANAAFAVYMARVFFARG